MVGIIDEAQLFYPLGTRIKIANNYGTVRYVGEVRSKKISFITTTMEKNALCAI